MTKPRSLFVGVANGTYVELKHLDRAVPDTRNVADVLKNRSGFETEVLPDAGTGLSGKLQKIITPQSMVGGCLILSWVGHGEASSHALQLVVPDHENKVDVKYGDMRTLAGDVLDTGARQMILIIDTCHSGAASATRQRRLSPASTIEFLTRKPGSGWWLPVNLTRTRSAVC